MLVLSRKIGEHVIIDHNVQVTVVEVSGSRVRLGFKAPAEVSIQRDEVYRRILAEQAEIEIEPVLSELPRSA